MMNHDGDPYCDIINTIGTTAAAAMITAHFAYGLLIMRMPKKYQNEWKEWYVSETKKKPGFCSWVLFANGP